jgi:hypothetical protein
VKVGEHYLKSNAHVVNEKLYFAKGSESMPQQIIRGTAWFLEEDYAICLDFSLPRSQLPHDKIHNNANIICVAKCF